MQTLFGLNPSGEVRHTEPLNVLSLTQMFSLARSRFAYFARVEVWEDEVCVLRLPPQPDHSFAHAHGLAHARS